MRCRGRRARHKAQPNLFGPSPTAPGQPWVDSGRNGAERAAGVCVCR